MEKNVLLFVGGYLPGVKSGGPVRTVSNLVEALGSEFNFFIVCADRDLGDCHSYPDIVPGKYFNVGCARVMYVAPNTLGLFQIIKLLVFGKFSLVILNSFFSFKFSIFPNLLRILLRMKVPFVIGPRGEFSCGALGVKSQKKTYFIYLAKKLGLYRDIPWLASSDFEMQDIRRIIHADRIYVAPDLFVPPKNVVFPSRASGSKLSIVFLARVARIKNLLFALEVLEKVDFPVDFDLYGPIEDADYWDECLDCIGRLPKNVCVRHQGLIEHSKVHDVLTRYDLFFLPSLGENFCHAIIESFSCGVPVLVSDLTPWRGLREKGVGWDLCLDNVDGFRSALEESYRLSGDLYSTRRHSVRQFAFDIFSGGDALLMNKKFISEVGSFND